MSNPAEIFNKPPQTTRQHIDQLIDRGLILDNTEIERVEHYLTHIGYYRLSAYLVPFEEKNIKDGKRNHQLIKGTQFNQVLDLYIFDRKLRILVMEAIERIEVSVRANWSNAITLENADAHAYMNPNLFKKPWLHQKNLDKVTKELAQSEEQSIKHYKNKYAQPFLPPTWAMIETLTFGSLSHWFANTQSTEVKKIVTKSLGLPTNEVTQSVLQSLSLIRNICAHHGRLWNRQLVKQLPNIRKLKTYMVIEQVTTKDGKSQQQPNRKLFNYLLTINHIMQTIQPKTSWSQRLDQLLATLPANYLQKMGLPITWQGFA